MKKITIADVARKAGLSPTTVSRVLNHRVKGHMRAETKQRVLAAIQELGYKPNIIARSLAKNETKTVGVLVPDISNPFFSSLVRGIESALHKQGYHLILCDNHWAPDREREHVETLLQRQIDGLIITGLGSDVCNIKDILPRRLPIVVMGREFEEEKFDLVACDNYRGGYEATKCLVNLGHKRIAYIMGIRHQKANIDRMEGYLKCLKDHGIPSKKVYIVQGDYTIKGGYRAMRKLLHLFPPVTGVFVANDQMAVGVIRAVYEQGLGIPNDISIVGFDNTMISSLTVPSLTTIAQPCEKQGAIAARLLLKKIKGKNKNKVERILVEPTLVVRESSGKPKEDS